MATRGHSDPHHHTILPKTFYLRPVLEVARDLVALPLPAGEQITLKYVMVSHERIEHSVAHRFLSAEIAQVIESFRERYGLPDLARLRAERGLPY